MRISAIKGHAITQPKYAQNRAMVRARMEQPEKPQPVAPAFKGGDGALVGLGLGLSVALVATFLTGGAALPALIGEIGVVASGLGGAYVGDKVGDAISGKKDE